MNKTKKIIFNSAIKIFSVSGYDGATMDDIASTAGLAKGTLYYHFKSKEEIFKYIITEGLVLIKEELEMVIDKEENLLLRLKLLFKTHLRLVCRYKDYFRIIMSQLWGQDDRHIELRSTVEKHISYIEQHIQEAIDKGIIKNVDPYFTAYNFWGLLCSTAIYELNSTSKDDLEDAIDHFTSHFLDGILIRNI